MPSAPTCRFAPPHLHDSEPRPPPDGFPLPGRFRRATRRPCGDSGCCSGQTRRRCGLHRRRRSAGHSARWSRSHAGCRAPVHRHRSSRSRMRRFRSRWNASHACRLRRTFWTSGWISTSSAAPESARPESPNAVRGVFAQVVERFGRAGRCIGHASNPPPGTGRAGTPRPLGQLPLRAGTDRDPLRTVDILEDGDRRAGELQHAGEDGAIGCSARDRHRPNRSGPTRPGTIAPRVVDGDHIGNPAVRVRTVLDERTVDRHRPGSIGPGSG